MIRELDRVVLKSDLRAHKLKRGDVGTVVLCHGRRGFEVEFLTLSGRTVTVVSVDRTQVRPIARDEIPHARRIRVA